MAKRSKSRSKDVYIPIEKYAEISGIGMDYLIVLLGARKIEVGYGTINTLKYPPKETFEKYKDAKDEYYQRIAQKIANEIARLSEPFDPPPEPDPYPYESSGHYDPLYYPEWIKLLSKIKDEHLPRPVADEHGLGSDESRAVQLGSTKSKIHKRKGMRVVRWLNGDS